MKSVSLKVAFGSLNYFVNFYSSTCTKLLVAVEYIICTLYFEVYLLLRNNTSYFGISWYFKVCCQLTSTCSPENPDTINLTHKANFYVTSAFSHSRNSKHNREYREVRGVARERYKRVSTCSHNGQSLMDIHRKNVYAAIKYHSSGYKQ